MTAMHARGVRVPEAERAKAEFLVRRLLGPDPEIEVLVDLKDWLDAEFG